MKGTEKQIAWAEDIKARVIRALGDPINKTTAESKMITDTLAAALNEVEYAGQIITMFKDVRSSGNAEEVSKSIMSEIRINPVTKKWAMEALNYHA